MSGIWDAIVIGSGPLGAATARRLAERVAMAIRTADTIAETMTAV